MTIQKKRLSILLFIAAVMLLIPFMAMQFTNEVQWSLFDFIVAAFLLFGLVVSVELVLRKVKNPLKRFVIGLGLLIVFLLLWLELAVGIFGSPLAGN